MQFPRELQARKSTARKPSADNCHIRAARLNTRQHFAGAGSRGEYSEVAVALNSIRQKLAIHLAGFCNQDGCHPTTV